MEHWYVVHTKPRQETQALDNLARQGYTAYCPHTVQPKHRRQRWRQVVEPLFPRYLFIQLAAGLDDFAPIRSTFGVVGLVRFGGQPAVIPKNAIETIRQQEQHILGEASNHPDWRVGDRLEIIHGPFAGLKGIFQKARGTDRVMVLLEMLGRQNVVTIEMHDVLPAQ